MCAKIMTDKIKIRDLKVSFHTPRSVVNALDKIDLELNREILTGLIGETGCGKSVLGMSILRLLPKNAQISGEISYNNKSILNMNREDLRWLRKKEISLISQNPSTSLNPIMRIGEQISESLYLDGKYTKNEAKQFTYNILKKLKLAGIENKTDAYPFQLSEGMKERVLAAIGIVREPAWIIADEPTKGLDALLRKTVYEIFKNIYEQTKAGMILITHDLRLSEKLCDRIVVMYAGQIIEDGKSKDIFINPKHPYTRGLISALPSKGFKAMPGSSPGLTDLPTGCRFHPRCSYSNTLCSQSMPPLIRLSGDTKVRCYLYDQS